MSDRERGQGQVADPAREEAKEGPSAEEQAAERRVTAARHRRWIQRKATRRGGAPPARAPQGGGTALAEDVRGGMEQQLGADLSDVRVHTGGESAAAAEQLGARAFTTGADVHFGAGQFAPGTKEGDRLLAHELTHVVQGQTSGVKRKAASAAEHDADAEVSQPHEPAEQEADHVADHAAEALHGGHDGDAKGAAPPAVKQAAPAAGRKIMRKGGGAQAGGGVYNAKPGGKAGNLPPPPADVLGPKKAGPDAKTVVAGPGDKQPPKQEPIEEFGKALNANSPKARDLWQQVPAKDRTQVTPSEIAKALGLDPQLGVEVMKDTATTFSKHPEYAKQILDAPNAQAFVQPLDQANLVNDLINAPPIAQNVTQKQAQALQHFFPVAPQRRLFEKVYPQLQDTTYDAKFVQTGVWGTGEIEKLYGVLAKWSPVAHVHASSEGFWQALKVSWNRDGNWADANFAWQQGRKMVLPKTGGGAYAASADSQEHDMTGGKGAGAQGKAKEANEKDQPPLQGHFEGSVLHEVGHAVANTVGGNQWATDRNHFEKISMETWSKKLFDDSVDKKFKKGLIIKKLQAGAVSGRDARMFLASQIAGGNWLPPGFPTPDAVLAFIQQNYADQPLFKYYLAKRAGDDYKIPDENVVGGKAYAHLSRFDNSFCRYDAKTFQNRVSWYSVSSPAEWFAENYAHYFRTGGKGLEGDVKQKMDAIAKMSFDPNKKGKDGEGGALEGGSAKAGAAAGGGGGDKIKPEEAEGQGGAGAAGGQAEKKPPVETQRLPFPW